MLQDEQTLRRTVAKNIAAYRKSHKDTQLDLARKLNYSDKSVSKWERGEGLPDVYILAQIAQLYGVTVSNLIGEEEPPKKANPHFHIYVLLIRNCKKSIYITFPNFYDYPRTIKIKSLI